jgi:hypothetical protein
MGESRDQKSFWATLLSFWNTMPDFLKGCAAVITAIGTLGTLIGVIVTVLVTTGLIEGPKPDSTSVPPMVTSVPTLPTATTDPTFIRATHTNT